MIVKRPRARAEADEASEKVSTIGMKLTETGNAERLVARNRHRIRYCPPRRRWLIWDGRRWACDERGLIQQLAKQTVRKIYAEAEHVEDEELRKRIGKHAADSEKASRRQAMITLAQTEAGIPVMPSELDSDPWAFNVQNGTVDLRTGELRQHRAADLNTKLSHVEYTPGAKHDLWDRYLRQATGGDEELEAYLRRAVGYALQGGITEKAFWFIYGPPDGTKSTFIEAVSAAFGEYAASTAFTTWLVQTSTGGNRGDLVSLMGARLVYSVEVRKGARYDEALMKAVTGGDEIKASAKYESEVSFKPSFALWQAGNDAPTIRDDDEGMWSRARRVPFENPIPKDRQDPLMRERLRQPAVQGAILAWAVQGCLEWQQSGLGSCAAVDRSSEDYRTEMDRIAGFLSERCLFGTEEKVETTALRAAYESWCRENGVKHPMSGKDFGERLGARKCIAGKSNGKRVWKGLRLLGDWEDPPEGQQGQQGTPPLETFSRRDTRENSLELPSLGVPAVPVCDSSAEQGGE